jgi:hypothetical protein
MFVSRLDERGMTAACLRHLVSLVLSNYHGGSSPTGEMLDADAGRTCKTAWLQFLRDHGEELRKGKRFRIGDPVVPIRDLFPKFEFDLSPEER